MKFKGICLVVLVVACSPSPKEASSGQSDPPVEPKESFNPEIDNCFDVKMDTWFTAFVRYQNEGDQMGVADAKAWTDAEQAFADCSGGEPEKLINRAKE